MGFIKKGNLRRYALKRFLVGALTLSSLGSEGCISDGGYYSDYHRHPSTHYIHHDPHYHYGSLDPRLDLQHEKLNNWYQHQLERAERIGFRPGELYRINQRYYNGLLQLDRAQYRRGHDFQRRLERDINETLRRIERHAPRRYYRGH